MMHEFQKPGDPNFRYDVRKLANRLALPCSIQVPSFVHTAAVRNLVTSVQGLSDVIEKKAEKS